MTQALLSLFSTFRQSLLQQSTKILAAKQTNTIERQHNRCFAMLPRISFSSDFFFRQVNKRIGAYVQNV